MFNLFKFMLKKWPQIIIIASSVVAQCFLQLMLPERMGVIQGIIAKMIGLDEAGKAQWIQKIWIEGGYMALISVGVAFCAIITCFMASHVSSYVGRELRSEIFTKVENMDLPTYNKFGTATLITRTTNDVEQVKNFLLMFVRILIMSPTMMVIAIIKTFQAQGDTNLAIVLAFCLPLVLIVLAIIMWVATPLFKQIQKRMDNVTTVLRETLTGVRVIRAYNQQDEETKKFTKVNADMTKTIKKVGHVMTWGNPSINIAFNICYLAIYALGFSSFDGKIATLDFQNSIAVISVVAQYAMQIMMSFLMFAMVFVMMPQASASAKRINEILDTKNSIEETNCLSDEEVKKLSNNEKGKLEFKNVSFQYPDASAPCIENLTFTVNPGTTTAIIGSTGSGKSSIINLIPRFYDATSGETLLDNVPLNQISKKSLRDRIGFVPQTAVLFSGTIRDNIRFGNEEATDEEIYKALDVAQATHFLSKLDTGIDTIVSQGGKNFSGGQKQRLAIARALIRKPEIFVFDDSFSALDFKTDIKLRSALKSYISPETSVIIVAQRVSTIINADNIIVLDDGRIVGQGTHKQLLVSCPVYQNIVSSQLDPDEVNKTLKMQNEAVLEGGN